jgi:UDP-glucose 4-epimerase
LRGLDLNQGPSGYEPDELPDCSTPRLLKTCYITLEILSKCIVKNIIVIIGGAGFVGSNLIDLFIRKTKFNIISYDDYSSGVVTNHIKNNRVKYLKGHTINIEKIINNYKNRINTLFHFGEFSRIHQSFSNVKDCFESNISGTKCVLEFCLKNKIQIIYSATSANLGNSGKDENLSPYALTKANNLKLIVNLGKWFGLKYKIVYFYNVYGPRQILNSSMAAVIGIFEYHFKNNKPIPVVYPGTQKRKFTHVNDTVQACYNIWKKKKGLHYSIVSNKSYSILKIAKMFSNRIKMLPKRKGERYFSVIKNRFLDYKIVKIKSRIDIKDYIKQLKQSYFY